MTDEDNVELIINEIAVIILNYRSWKDTIKEINLCNALLKIKFKNIIVVDNASPNESADILRRDAEKKGYIFIGSNINKGYAAGNNIGLRYAYSKGYKYAWILNNDIIIKDAKIIEKLFSVFIKDNSVAAVSPDIYSVEGYMYNRDAQKPTFFDYTIGILRYRKSGRKVIDLGGYAYVYRPQGCCMMIDLKITNDIEYLDEHTFLYMEEAILAERFLVNGYRCACCLNTSIIHNHSKTVKSSFNTKKIRKINNDSLRYYLSSYRHFTRIQILLCCAFNWIKWQIMEK